VAERSIIVRISETPLRKLMRARNAATTIVAGLRAGDRSAVAAGVSRSRGHRSGPLAEDDPFLALMARHTGSLFVTGDAHFAELRQHVSFTVKVQPSTRVTDAGSRHS